VGGVPDVVEHDTTGVLVPPRDVAAFSAALVALARDRSRRVSMGLVGRERARTRYAHRRLVDDIQALYEQGLRALRT